MTAVRHLVVVALAAACDFAAASGSSPSGAEAYPVSGYWMFGRPNAGAWAAALARTGDLGADTVVQFGPRLARRTEADISSDPLFSECARDAVDPPVRQRYVYATQESFGSAFARDPRSERRVERDGRLAWRLVFAAPGTNACDLVFVSGRTNDSVRALFEAAAAGGQRVFAGLPCAAQDSRCPWDPDLAALPVLEELTRRILADYAERYGASPAFEGVYQTLETPVSRACLAKVLAVYKAQHALVRAALPGKKILISPYWDARRTDPNGTDAASVRDGVRLLARQNVDAIAPQDSRGTGKVGLFWPDEAADLVDVRLAPVVGAVTYGEAYRACTTDFYREARLALDEAEAQEGLRVSLWANIEAFEPGPSSAVSGLIRRTTAERLDRAVMFAGLYPSKLISFMWDGFYTSASGLPQSLADELAAGPRRPIIVLAQARQAGGWLVWGYGLEGAFAEFSYERAGGGRESVTAALQEPPPGAVTFPGHALPAALQVRWARGCLFDLADGARIEVSAVRGGARSHHPYRVFWR